jgi:hypothetical protein
MPEMWWRRLFRRDAMMIWLMRATEKEGDGTLDHANRRIMQYLRERSKQEKGSRASKGKRCRRRACRSESQPLKGFNDALINDRRLYAGARIFDIIKV